MFPLSQVQFGVFPRKVGDETAGLMQTQEQAAQIADMSGVSTNNMGLQSLGRGTGKALKMPYFDEERDFMDSHLGCFERFAICQRWNQTNWALHLSALIKGRALDVYSMLPAHQANNYDQLKATLLKDISYQPLDLIDVSEQANQNLEKLQLSSLPGLATIFSDGSS